MDVGLRAADQGDPRARPRLVRRRDGNGARSAIALGVTAAIVVVSLAIDRQLWSEWISFLSATPEGGSVAQFQIPVPLWLRLPLAIIVVVWGALTDRRWTVPLAATLALPVLWISGFAICAACLPLARRQPTVEIAA